MKTIINIMYAIAMALLALVIIGVVWFTSWSKSYVQNMNAMERIEMAWHTEVLDEDADTYMIEKFQHHVLATIGLD